MKISIFGTGYVGLVTGVCFAEMGNDVLCVDIDERKVQSLRQGKSPIYEPGLDTMLSENIKAGRIHFTTNSEEAIAKSELLFIAVGTPPNEDGSADLKYVLEVAGTIAKHMTNYKVVVTKSTVPVGTNAKIKKKIREVLTARGANIDFDICSNPEFLREGCAIQDCMKTNRVVVGVETDKAAKLMAELYEPFLKSGNPLIVMDPVSSEMTKYAANAMLAAKISIMNEFSKLCEKVGADIEHVRRGIGTDHRIGPYSIYAGVGYGGSCFPKDVKALIKTGDDYDESLDILKAVELVNHNQRVNFYKKVQKHFAGDVSGKHFAVWGAAFKPGTDDIREAPSLYIIEQLLTQGATVTVFDSVAAENAKWHFNTKDMVSADVIKLAEKNLRFTSDQYEALKGAHALIIPTEWKSFKEPDFNKIKSLLKAPVIFDGRNIYHPQRMKDLGFQYYCIGRTGFQL